MLRLIPVFLVLAAAQAGCGEGSVNPSRDGGGGGGRFDVGVRYDVGGGGTPDTGVVKQHGDPCNGPGDCGSDPKLACISQFCRVKCTQPKQGCNHPATECPAGTSCFSATTFTDACFPSTKKLGEKCDENAPCAAGFICIQLSTEPRCYALCDFGSGCQANEDCRESTRSCRVCIPKSP